MSVNPRTGPVRRQDREAFDTRRLGHSRAHAPRRPRLLGDGLRERARSWGFDRKRSSLPWGNGRDVRERLRLHRRSRRLRRSRNRRCAGPRRSCLDRRRIVGHVLRADRRRLRLRQEEERVHIAVRVRGDAHSEIDVRLCELWDPARANRPDDLSLTDGNAPPHRVRPEVQQRDRVAVRGLDRDGLTAPRNRSGERNSSRLWRADRCPGRGPDVDPPMLPRRVRIRAKREGRQDRPGNRPAPAECRRREDQRSGCDQEDEDAQEPTSVVTDENAQANVARPLVVVKSGYSEPR